MSVPLRLLGLLLTAVGLVVATTGLVLLVQPLDTDRPATRSADERGDAAPEPDSRAAGSPSPLPIAASPGVAQPSPPTPTSPPTSPPRAADHAEDPGGSTPPDIEARSPTVTTVSHPVGSPPSPDVPAPSRPQSETFGPGPTEAAPPPPAPPPTPSSPPPTAGVASDDADRDQVRGSTDPCRDTWPWAGRRGSRGRGDGWGPPLPCDGRAVGAGARGARPPGSR